MVYETCFPKKVVCAQKIKEKKRKEKKQQRGQDFFSIYKAFKRRFTFKEEREKRKI
jgi:hypothetical protein